MLFNSLADEQLDVSVRITDYPNYNENNTNLHNNAPIALDYSTSDLRLLIEEYLYQQKSDFTLKGVCSYVLYWAMEEGRTAGAGKALYESNQLQPSDCERISHILESIVKDGRIAKVAGDGTRYLKQ